MAASEKRVTNKESQISAKMQETTSFYDKIKSCKVQVKP